MRRRVGRRVKREARRGLGRVLEGWPQKLAALGLAVLFWFFVSNDETVITQRSLLVPLTTLGISANQLAVGVPERVEVTVSGPGPRVDALRGENLDAVLDLRGAENAFERSVNVFPPQGLTLVRVNPSEVIGFVETRGSKSVPVRVAYVAGGAADGVTGGAAGGAPPADILVTPQATPEAVTVRGRAGTLEEVTAALAIVNGRVGDGVGDGVSADGTGENSVSVAPYAVDASGLPVEGVVLEPAEVSVTLSREPVLHTRTLPLTFMLPDTSPLTIEESALSQAEVTLAGPKELLEPLTEVTATVEPATLPEAPGGYTLPLTLGLPEGVSALEPPTVTLRLAGSAGEPDPGGG